MTDAQILAIALATVPNMITVLIGILINNAQLSDLRSSMDVRFSELLSHMDSRFNGLDRRLEDDR